MIGRLKRAAMATVFLAGLAPALAQAPTEAQRAAIRSACRSDYIAHCSSVSPGGMESLQCLQKNMASLSGSCKSAVTAVDTPAKTEAPAGAPKADMPAAEPVKPAATATPAAPAAAPPAGAAVAPAAPKAPATTKKPAPAAAATPSPPAATLAAPAAAMTLRPMRPREQVLVLRSACGGDVRSLCAGVAPGGGRIVQCLAANAASLSPACKDVLSQFRAQ